MERAKSLGRSARRGSLPFPDLEFVISAAALAIAVLILASQGRADILADAREKMTLELSLQNAQKISKVIELLEELRRDSPNVRDRTDPEAEDMSHRRSETEILENIPGSASNAVDPAISGQDLGNRKIGAS